MLKTFTYQKDPSLAPKKLVFLLHGLGSNGQDLLGLAPSFAAELSGDVLFISPDAPDICDMAPAGYAGSYQWFSLQNRDPSAMAQNTKAAAAALQDYIDLMIKKHDVAYKDVALIGFSQGTMVSLYAGIRTPEPVAGIVGYSGSLIVPPDEKSHKTLIALIHGTADDVVPSAASEMAHAEFEQKGYDITLDLCPGLAHGIDPKGQENGAKFLKSVLT